MSEELGQALQHWAG